MNEMLTPVSYCARNGERLTECADGTAARCNNCKLFRPVMGKAGNNLLYCVKFPWMLLGAATRFLSSCAISSQAGVSVSCRQRWALCLVLLNISTVCFTASDSTKLLDLFLFIIYFCYTMRMTWVYCEQQHSYNTLSLFNHLKWSQS